MPGVFINDVFSVLVPENRQLDRFIIVSPSSMTKFYSEKCLNKTLFVDVRCSDESFARYSRTLLFFKESVSCFH